MRLIVESIADECFHFVVDAAWFSRISRSWLQCDRGWTVRWELKVKGIGMFAQLFDQPLLQTCQRPFALLQLRENLRRGQVQVLAKSQT